MFFYDRVINGLQLTADHAVPRLHKNFFKYWWNQEMDELKHRSVLSSRLWKEAGRLRNGPIFNRYRADKAVCRHGIRSRQQENIEIYTNDLHECLLRKDGVSFWKCWKSKFDNRSRSLSHINGITDPTTIAEHFATHFSKACTSNTQAGADRLKNEYVRLRKDYCFLDR